MFGLDVDAMAHQEYRTLLTSAILSLSNHGQCSIEHVPTHQWIGGGLTVTTRPVVVADGAFHTSETSIAQLMEVSRPFKCWKIGCQRFVVHQSQRTPHSNYVSTVHPIHGPDDTSLVMRRHSKSFIANQHANILKLNAEAPLAN